MADFRLRILKAITLAFRRSKIRNSEEHFNSQELNLEVYCLVPPWALPNRTKGQKIYLPYELFISFSPALSQVPRRSCSVVGNFLMYLSLEPFVYGSNESFCACA